MTKDEEECKECDKCEEECEHEEIIHSTNIPGIVVKQSISDGMRIQAFEIQIYGYELSEIWKYVDKVKNKIVKLE